MSLCCCTHNMPEWYSCQILQLSSIKFEYQWYINTKLPSSSLRNSINRNQCVKLWFPLGITAIFRPIKYWGGALMMGICYITAYQNASPSCYTQRLYNTPWQLSMFWLSSFQGFIDKYSWLNKTFCIWLCTFIQ